jgi:diguanylate cyclase (GGDEF)-like protein
MTFVTNSLGQAARRLRGFGRRGLLLAGLWTLGLVALGAMIVFEKRVDETRRAQVVIAKMQNQKGALLAIAFNPATARSGQVPRPAQTAAHLEGAKAVYNASLATLQGLGDSAAPASIRAASGRYFSLIDQLSELVAAGKSRPAALQLGRSEQPGGAESLLSTELQRADVAYGSDAARARTVTQTATVVAMLFMLLVFSSVLYYTLGARKRSQHDATTDALTGLRNRRALFADIDSGRARQDRPALTVGIFDLDGFKAYNDTFGHPAGDALLARLGGRLSAAVGSSGEAYRIGGDEFVVTAPAPEAERVLDAAQKALSEHGAGFSVGCSRGSAEIGSGVTLEQALHAADQRLYSEKRSSRPAFGSGTETKDALLQVLAEQNSDLITHVGHVAELAAMTAVGMNLSAEQVELTRLAAELHDVGKAAIPAAILDKPTALDPEERAFMQRHSAIGERIVGAAAALEPIAGIVRAAHERPDGNGYPDGLRLDEIPIGSRIIAVVDAYDAMTNDRPYRRAIPPAAALDELARHAGTQFDPDVVRAFADAFALHSGARRAA